MQTIYRTTAITLLHLCSFFKKLVVSGAAVKSGGLLSPVTMLSDPSVKESVFGLTIGTEVLGGSAQTEHTPAS